MIIRLTLSVLMISALINCSPPLEVTLFEDLKTQCSNDRVKYIFVYTPYDCDLCTENAIDFISRNTNSMSETCFLLFSKKSSGQSLIIGGDTIHPSFFFDKEAYESLNKLTYQNKYPVVLTDDYRIIKF